MSFMDKVKSAAQDVAAEAKKAGAQGQEKLGEVQTRRKLDDLAKQLGWLVYRERAENVPAGADAERLVAEMKELDARLESRGPLSPEVSSEPAEASGPREPGAEQQESAGGHERNEPESRST